VVELWRVTKDVTNKQLQTVIFGLGTKVMIEVSGYHLLLHVRGVPHTNLSPQMDCHENGFSVLRQSLRENAGIVY
jgi:hypothetical protein